MQTARESTITAAILKALNKLPGCVARKRHGTPYAVAGDPDITGCWYGQHFEFEVKRPGEFPTKLQERRLDEWRQAGATVAVVTSPAQAILALADIGAQNPNPTDPSASPTAHKAVAPTTGRQEAPRA